jgi:hypothetical protein
MKAFTNTPNSSDDSHGSKAVSRSGRRGRGETAPGIAMSEMTMGYSATTTPEPPISFGKSFNFGNPSFIGSLVS